MWSTLSVPLRCNHLPSEIHYSIWGRLREVYTCQGSEEGRIIKSTNYGDNWTNIHNCQPVALPTSPCQPEVQEEPDSNYKGRFLLGRFKGHGWAQIPSFIIYCTLSLNSKHKQHNETVILSPCGPGLFQPSATWGAAGVALNKVI